MRTVIELRSNGPAVVAANPRNVILPSRGEAAVHRGRTHAEQFLPDPGAVTSVAFNAFNMGFQQVKSQPHLHG
jgi:hypothetical protein